jgi:hypothetical protein
MINKLISGQRRLLLPALAITVGLIASPAIAQEKAPHDCFHRNQTLNDYLAQLEQQPDDDFNHVGAAGNAYDKTRNLQRKQGRQQFNKHIEQFRILKLLELLDLQENQELEFIGVFRSMRRQSGQLHDQRMDRVEKLAEGLRTESITDNEIVILISEIREFSDEENRGRDRFLSEAANILSASQMGRLVVFQVRFESELLGAVRGFRDRGRGPGKSPAPDSERP